MRVEHHDQRNGCWQLESQVETDADKHKYIIFPARWLDMSVSMGPPVRKGEISPVKYCGSLDYD